ncbi:Glycoside hydrolase family 2 N-terminal [Penicillium macrosclerotiorum]|uniref:Glycoside hydrolase family 2 N-terminal n=1 Tax=Penicillium macrosclerotiorum TaxID=303699 RepID=UPI0025466099|nr:Glycoside hydrolase family 2 N-terminal [Penicillium macrosclerotiorum]KAJ5691792.1 Glycoside hydrolase family 2 N-terminal [Penicillium macrosclerotiorum]
MQVLPPLSALFVALVGLLAAGSLAGAQPLVSSPGDIAIIPGWSLQSSTRVSGDMPGLSQPGVDVSSWHRVGPRGTVMAGLIHDGVYNDSVLFYSDNMKQLASMTIFQSPWIYREEFAINPTDGHYFTLHTHGITSKADIFVNGKRVASSEQQQGSYGGHKYNLTDIIHEGSNCILIRAYPTNYLRDFAQGFVDWNPYPADNGTGVWRNVEISQTGIVSMSPLRVITDFSQPGLEHAVNVTFKTDLVNHGHTPVEVIINGTVASPMGSQVATLSHAVKLKPNEKKTTSVKATIRDPSIWWPASWGDQPLYSVQAQTLVLQDKDFKTSDMIRPQRFGIRHVSAFLNEHNDTAFRVNGQPFQVLGGGYGPDIFLRFDETRVEKIFQYMLDMGLNTVRLEGKQEHTELYELADRMGMMVLAGWECCDKWEGWEYNHDANGVKWGGADYPIARASMLHEAEMMQPHPSMLGFLVGSDYWPNNQATSIYLNALKEMDWENPVIASASKRGYPEALGPSGMKMDGPYDWVPPNYWYGDKEGAAFGFGSELGAGVGTPELHSLEKFMSNADLEALWKEPEADLYHMSRYDSQFYDRSIYNKGLFARYGKPKSLDDYVLKCQMADYEATRAEFEAYSAHQSAARPATGAIYWMSNSAWPNLHWQLFDYYLSPMGAYFGTKVGTRMEHVAYDYDTENIWLINHSSEARGQREIFVDLIQENGKKISSVKLKAYTLPTSSKQLRALSGIDKIKDIAFLRLVLRDPKVKRDLSRNVYWLSPKTDTLDWEDSNWYTTPVTDYANYTKLESLSVAKVKASIQGTKTLTKDGWVYAHIQLENKSNIPAVFLRLNVLKLDGTEIAPVFWSDNYVTLWPKEKIRLEVGFESVNGDLKQTVIEISGRNIKKRRIKGFN